MSTRKNTAALESPRAHTPKHVKLHESSSGEESLFVSPEPSSKRRCLPFQDEDNTEDTIQQHIALSHVQEAHTKLQFVLANGAQNHVSQSTSPLALETNMLLPPQAAVSAHDEAPLPSLRFGVGDIPIYLVKQRITEYMASDGPPKVEGNFIDNFVTAQTLFANHTAIEVFAELVFPRTSDDAEVHATRLQLFKKALKNMYGIDNQTAFRGRKPTPEREIVVWVVTDTFRPRKI